MINFRALLLMAAALIPNGLHAAPLYHYAYEGTWNGTSFSSKPTALDPVQPGDLFRLSFDIDAATAIVQNIVALFPTRGIALTPTGTAGFGANAGASLYHYRWDIGIQEAPGYTMTFWFRTSQPGVVNPWVPETINPADFNTARHWSVYYGTPGTGGPQVMAIELTSATPEPSTFLLAVVSLSLLAASRVVRG